MKKIRIIARLDVKGPNVIKGVHLECLRVVGDPGILAQRYYHGGADEILYMDIVASLYGRNNLLDIVHKASEKIFVPLTVGGGIRTLEDIRALLLAGADKIALNTAVTKSPEFITKAAEKFGSQCIVISIEAKQTKPGCWEAYTDNGRERTGLDVIKWARRVEALGAGEILVTSIDQEGVKNGFDLELMRAVSSAVSLPLISSGGAGTMDHITKCARETYVDAIALASVLHYNTLAIGDVKAMLHQEGVSVRRILSEHHS